MWGVAPLNTPLWFLTSHNTSANYVAILDTFGSAHVGCSGVAMTCHVACICGKHYGLTRDTRQMCRIQAYKHYPCPRVGYPALGAGHARKTDGFVHRISKSIAPTQFLQLIYMRMSLSLLICSTMSSRSCSTSGTSDHGHEVQEGSFTNTDEVSEDRTHFFFQEAACNH